MKKELHLPKGTSVTPLRRNNFVIVPRGHRAFLIDGRAVYCSPKQREIERVYAAVQKSGHDAKWLNVAHRHHNGRLTHETAKRYCLDYCVK